MDNPNWDCFGVNLSINTIYFSNIEYSYDILEPKPCGLKPNKVQLIKKCILIDIYR